MSLFGQNTSVLGSMMEQLCLSAIGTFGLNHGSLHFKPKNRQGYKGDLLNLPDLGKPCSTLFVPNNPNNSHIDALYLETTNKPDKIALVVPIQITISNKHSHSDPEGSFYADWTKWQTHFQNYELSTAFVWIVEDERKLKNGAGS
jgi:hypothetical protein